MDIDNNQHVSGSSGMCQEGPDIRQCVHINTPHGVWRMGHADPIPGGKVTGLSEEIQIQNQMSDVHWALVRIMTP